MKELAEAKKLHDKHEKSADEKGQEFVDDIKNEHD
jgi:hypothetical protein